ncbi:MAG: hypothetical protein R3C69_12565 [Geminicoccaceae bacterium]
MIYGIVVMFALQQPVTVQNGGALASIGGLLGIALFYTGVWQGRALASAIAASRQDGDLRPGAGAPPPSSRASRSSPSSSRWFSPAASREPGR